MSIKKIEQVSSEICILVSGAGRWLGYLGCSQSDPPADDRVWVVLVHSLLSVNDSPPMLGQQLDRFEMCAFAYRPLESGCSNSGSVITNIVKSALQRYRILLPSLS